MTYINDREQGNCNWGVTGRRNLREDVGKLGSLFTLKISAAQIEIMEDSTVGKQRPEEGSLTSPDS